MKPNVYIYILVMAGVTYLIRMLPLALAKKEITNPFIKSFLFYVPYVTLAVMTFPAIVQATQSPIAGALALVLGMALARASARAALQPVARRRDSFRDMMDCSGRQGKKLKWLQVKRNLPGWCNV